MILKIVDAGEEYLLSGAITPNMDLSLLFESTQKYLTLNLKDISAMSSTGVKVWIDSIKKLRSIGKFIEYRECSEAFLEQCNMVPMMVKDVDVTSFYVNFMCEECEEYDLKLLETDELDLEDLPPGFPCPNCNESMLPEEDDAFDFLRNI
ncbi:MAG: hypothetical protein HQM11_09650 [SAR324 cluster bacterium]|nr:hypothetical protein [SAR324 cluster bacterium]